MDKSISSSLKTWFIVHMIVGAVFGVLFLLLPEMWGNLIGWPAKDPLIFRLFGAAIWGFTASSWFAYKETAWDKVKIVVQMEMVWLILGALVMLYGLFLGGAPALGGWLYFVVLGGLAAGFSYFYSRA